LKSNHRNILFTFDYELFLGARSGTVEKCLIEPTNLLIDLFDKYSIKSTIFFVDTTYLIRLEQEQSEACKKDLEAIKKQLRTLIQNGHYVFPHIHPHWMDAKYDSTINEWSLNDYSKYRFHHTSEKDRGVLFGESIRLLEEIIKPINSNYKINGYRAGGWSLQPFEDFLPYFKKYNISNEFSVVPGFKNLSEAQYFDFTDCPKKDIYNFDINPVIEQDNGSFREFTISTLEITSALKLKSKVWGKYLWKTGQRSIGKGSGLVIKDESVTNKKSDFLGSKNKEMISVELLTKVKLPYYKRFIDNSAYMHFISHPKMLSYHNIKTLESFLKHVSNRFVLSTDFAQLK